MNGQWPEKGSSDITWTCSVYYFLCGSITLCFDIPYFICLLMVGKVRVIFNHWQLFSNGKRICYLYSKNCLAKTTTTCISERPRCQVSSRLSWCKRVQGLLCFLGFKRLTWSNVFFHFFTSPDWCIEVQDTASSNTRQGGHFVSRNEQQFKNVSQLGTAHGIVRWLM
jgi:hypothetical protein